MRTLVTGLIPICLMALAAATAEAADGASATAATTAPADNPRIDMDAYLLIANQAAVHRRSHRLSEADFIAKMKDPHVVVLDARSKTLYDLRHVDGAINLSFPDISIPTLAKTLPDKDQVILIYCNNNFANDPKAFPSKAPPASLNLSTYIALYGYGYRNVYELGPLLDVATTAIPLVPSPVH